MKPIEFVLFAAFPYLAVFVAVGGGIWRFCSDRFSYSSLSSQFLENRKLFWGSAVWHFGIIIILLAHLIVFLLPGVWRALISNSTTLYVLEVIGLSLAAGAIAGILVLIFRRLANIRVKAVTSAMDRVLLVALTIQVVSGFWVALAYRWGASWYLDTSVPWLYSLVRLDPQIQYVTGLPFWVQFHMLWGFFIIALFPFTRLVHLVTVPIPYLWRPYQVVIWNKRRQRKAARG